MLKPSIRSRLRDAQLPGGRRSDGPFKFIPPDGYDPRSPLPRRGTGYLDRAENVWQRGDYHGDPAAQFTREWDVQLSASGLNYFKNLRFYKGSKIRTDKGYVNIRPDGQISH